MRGPKNKMLGTIDPPTLCSKVLIFESAYIVYYNMQIYYDP